MYMCVQATLGFCFLRVSASGLACKWLGGDGLPSLVPVTTTYGYIDDTYQLKCPEMQFPVLSNGVCPKV